MRTGARTGHGAPKWTLQERARAWWHEPGGASRRWLGKPSVLVAWLGLLLAVVSPPHGSGISLCWQHAATGLPCLGCGITRSLSCGLRGMFADSLGYHPMGLAILALFVLVAGQSLLPGRIKEELKNGLETRATLFNSLYLTFVTVFVVYGTGRALLQAAEVWPCTEFRL